jgi:predicted nucleic acid-binding protein
MSTPRVYLDTSVIGGCCDDEFAKWSQALLRDIRLGLLVPVISDLTERELEQAPLDVQDVYDELRDIGCQRVSESLESMKLAAKYLSEGILPENYEADARHVAVATVHGVDVLVTWNFKHIVRYDKIRRFNAVNALMGYSPLQIHTPMEVASEEEV